MFNVTPSKEKALKEKMSRFGISEADIKETFLRSGGKGGQNVNKVSTCVYLKHIPSGTEVKCARERSQSLNRFFARRILTEKIEKAVLGKKAEAEKRAARIRRQKRKRSARAKEKMLADKKKLSRKKDLRKKIRDENN